MKVSIKSFLLNAADRIDGLAPGVDVFVRGKSKHLLILLVHSLFRTDGEVRNAKVYPHERMTVDKFVCLIKKLKEIGYEFIHAEQVDDPDSLPERSALLTFDDAYKSISHAVQPMEDLAVPGLVFVVPWNIVHGECFWWDVLYRRLLFEGRTEKFIYSLIDEKKRLPVEEVRGFIVDRWGERALCFESDLDRPLTLEELKDISANPLFSLGNHTYRHTALPFRDGATISAEIRKGNQCIRELFGRCARLFAFPNGDYSTDAVLRACEEGARYCLSIEPRGCVIHQGAGNRIPNVLGRFMVSGERSIERQVYGMTRAVSVASSIKRLKRHKYS